MANSRKSIIFNENYTEYFQLLAENGLKRPTIVNNSKKGKSIVYDQLKILVDEEYLIMNNKEFEIEWNKLIEDFVIYLLSKGEDLNRDWAANNLNNLTNNQYIINLLKTSLIYSLEDPSYMLMFIGKESNENSLSLIDIFESIKQVFLNFKMEDIIFSGVYDFKKYKLDIDNLIPMLAEKDLEFGNLINLIDFTVQLHLDYDENLRDDIVHSLNNLIFDNFKNKVDIQKYKILLEKNEK